MKCFNFRNISKDDVYVGNIMLVRSIDYFELDYMRQDNVLSDLSDCVESLVAKKDAILIKVSDNCYVDVDSIKELSDCDFINYCLKNNISDNILLCEGTEKPYIGELFVKNIKKINNINKNTDIIELKLVK